MKFSRQLLLSLLLSLIFSPIFGQEMRENDQGEKIIVWPDGSWQYFSDFGSEDPGSLHGRQNAGSEQSFPIYDGTIAPLEGYVSITENDILKIAVRKSQLAKDAADIASERSKQAKEVRLNIEKELANAMADAGPDQEEIRRIRIRLEAAKKTELSTDLEAREAMEGAQRAKEMTAKGAYVEAYLENQDTKKRQSLLSTEQRQISGQNYQNILPLTESYTGDSKKDDLILNPPPPPCSIVFEGNDERTGRPRRDVQQQVLFTYTDERLRPYLKDKEYLRCEGFLTSIGGGFRYLTLVFTFAYPNAREAYGFIEKGSVLTIKMLNGNFVNLFSGKMDRGSYNTKTQLLTYRVHYPIDRGQLGLLEKDEVDAFRVFWSSGYEEYEVFQLDFFQSQLDCLEQD
ncbi:MAG: hypothetical protein KDC85_23660 [Saprospiraceae bacterium]|nr:hypothetical protein [Saprospiraceae bacterium]MCB9326015.1 hypothetical protein [Lewinellaceae bacterium]